ncbi:hypothetical protein [Brevundimonas lenta]|uniref:Uncharacterized protein n=1 Tax=Brevundimonas lenta TaxID=424796 RepID=A0A7W6JE14_9CAUL|nr:hypothetical protein [Brevundimonas lenta]MBB4083410.1 hypothetical protein [Brevundimonas lenta]
MSARNRALGLAMLKAHADFRLPPWPRTPEPAPSPEPESPPPQSGRRA